MRHGKQFPLLTLSQASPLRMFGVAFARWAWLVALVALMSAGSQVSAQVDWGKINSNVIDDIGFKGRTVVLVQVAVPKSDPAGRAFTRVNPHLIRKQQQSVLKKMTVGDWRLRHQYATIPFLALEIDEDSLAGLAKMDDVLAVELDQEIHGALMESVAAIGADWVKSNLGVDGSGITVGIIDTGIDTDHPDLVGAVVAGRRYLDQGADVGTDIEDDNGHGTHTAGIITGDGIEAPAGVAPGATLVVIKALDNFNEGHFSDLIAGIDWIIDNHGSFPTLKFINLSLVASEPTSLCPCDDLSGFGALKAAVDRAEAAGIIVMAATGNDGDPSQISAPACFSNVIAIGASYDSNIMRAPEVGSFANCFDTNTQTHQVACFTNRNACLDFLAPGYLIQAAKIGGSFEFHYGTSQAVPHAVGTMALMQAHDQEGRSATELVDILRDSAPMDPSSTYLRIDARAALESMDVSSLVMDWTIYR